MTTPQISQDDPSASGQLQGFPDHFSKTAREYASYRPGYPAELFAYLADLTPGHALAWDCGTGNGQAALGLAQHFERVVATDASAGQIAQAFPHERVEYRVEKAEEPGLEARSVDLVTVAIAVHWFDLSPFYAAVRRVLRPNGILAVWTYHLPWADPAIDEVISTFYRSVLAGFWPEQWRYLDEHYRTLPFPFLEVEPPAFETQASWNLNQLAGFLSGWSASQKYQKAHEKSPLEAIWPALARAWGPPENPRVIRWPLYLRVGQVSS